MFIPVIFAFDQTAKLFPTDKRIISVQYNCQVPSVKYDEKSPPLRKCATLIAGRHLSDINHWIPLCSCAAEQRINECLLECDLQSKKYFVHSSICRVEPIMLWKIKLDLGI
jgi:hypothetical protein